MPWLTAFAFDTCWSAIACDAFEPKMYGNVSKNKSNVSDYVLILTAWTKKRCMAVYFWVAGNVGLLAGSNYCARAALNYRSLALQLQADRPQWVQVLRRQVPGAGVATGQSGSALLAAAAIPHKGVKVLHLSDVGHMLRVVGTHHRQSRTHGLILLQHVQHLLRLTLLVIPRQCIQCTD